MKSSNSSVEPLPDLQLTIPPPFPPSRLPSRDWHQLNAKIVDLGLGSGAEESCEIPSKSFDEYLGQGKFLEIDGHRHHRHITPFDRYFIEEFGIAQKGLVVQFAKGFIRNIGRRPPTFLCGDQGIAFELHHAHSDEPFDGPLRFNDRYPQARGYPAHLASGTVGFEQAQDRVMVPIRNAIELVALNQMIGVTRRRQRINPQSPANSFERPLGEWSLP